MYFVKEYFDKMNNNIFFANFYLIEQELPLGVPEGPINLARFWNTWITLA